MPQADSVAPSNKTSGAGVNFTPFCAGRISVQTSSILAEHGRDEAAHLIGRRGSLALRTLGLGLRLRLAPTAHVIHHLGAADQDPRVDAERVRDQAEDNDRADA